MAQGLSVLLFNDYRAYLAAHVQQMKGRNPLWSVGAHFVVLGEGDTVVLKRVAPPAAEDIRELLADAEKQAKQAGLTKADVRKAISDVRKRR